MCAINHAWERSGFSKRAGSTIGPPDCPDCPAPTHHFHTFKRSLARASVAEALPEDPGRAGSGSRPQDAMSSRPTACLKWMKVRATGSGTDTSIDFIKSLSPLELCMSSTEAPRRGNPPDRQGSFAPMSGNEDARRITEAPRRGNPPDRQGSPAEWPPEDHRSGNEDARRIAKAPKRGNPPDRQSSLAGWPPEDGRSTETRSCGEHWFEKRWLWAVMFSVVSGVFCFCVSFLLLCFDLVFLSFLGFSVSVFPLWFGVCVFSFCCFWGSRFLCFVSGRLCFVSGMLFVSALLLRSNIYVYICVLRQIEYKT